MNHPCLAHVCLAHALVLCLALSAGGCDLTKKGDKGGRCLDGDTCSGELTCLSGRCVQVPDDFCDRAAKKKTGAGPAGPLDPRKRKAATAEALAALKKIGAGARLFFVSDHFDRTGALLPRIFPKSDGKWSPAASCCKQDDGTCPADAALWQGNTWKSLHFDKLDPHRYQYRFVSAGEGAAATFTAEARGDLDCDNERSLFRLTGKVTAEGSVVTSKIFKEDELE